ncbi:MAG: mercuric transporter MerT family protein [Thermoanaerobaculia bacterium]
MADLRRRGRFAKAGAGAALVSAFTASLCCIGPIAAATLGLTSLGALARFEGLRPWFTALTLVFLSIAFFLSYRRRPEGECAPGSLCDVHGEAPVRRVNRTVLWIAAILAVAVLTFPSWSTWVLG